MLIDGSLQFGDLRALLKVPTDAPSILDLPTDRIAEADLSDVLWRDPSGIDILLAPPRVEMAEMVTPRDVDKILSLLRRVYQAIVIDMSSVVSDINLSFLDASDTIIEIVTYDSTTIHNTIAMADTFRSIGYPASKVQYLVNRADSPGGIEPDDLQRALGRVPEHRVVSDGQLVVRSNNEGVPFVLANPSRPGQPGPRARRGGHHGTGRRACPPPLAADRDRVRPPTDRRLRLRGRRPHGPPRDRPAIARTNRRSTSATTDARRTASAPTTRSSRSRRRPSTRSSSATSRRSSSPATPRRRSGSATSGGATTCRSSA